MTEERIKQAAQTIHSTNASFAGKLTITEGVLRTVAAEARKEGMDEMVEAVFLELGGDVDREFLEGIAAERLKEQG